VVLLYYFNAQPYVFALVDCVDVGLILFYFSVLTR